MKRMLVMLAFAAGCAGGISSARGQEVYHYWVTGNEKIDQEFKEHLDKAIELQSNGKYPDAVKEYRWCLDNRHEHFGPEFEKSVVKMIIENIHSMGMRSTRIKGALEKRRSRLEEKFRQGEGSLGMGHELDVINKQLGDWFRMLNLYDELKSGGENGKKMRELLFMYIEEEMLEDERYEDFLKGAGKGPASLEVRRNKIERAKETLTEHSGETEEQDPQAQIKAALCRSAARYYQANLATGKKDEARKIADEYLEFYEKPRTFATFIEAAVKAKKYDEARKVYADAKETFDTEKEMKVVKRAAKKIPKSRKTETENKGKDSKTGSEKNTDKLSKDG